MLKVGDHLKTPRGLYTHHGLYIGNDEVIHYSGLSDGMQSGPVDIVTLEDFCGGHGYKVILHDNRKYSRQESVERAKSRIGEDAYSVTGNNCEHFVNWCIDGDHRSAQVDIATGASSGAVSVATSLGSRVIIGSLNSVSVLSRARFIGGLGKIGSVASGGTVSGLVVLAGSGGLVMASLLNKTVLKDNAKLDKNERKARSVGRKLSYTGAIAGTVGSVAAVTVAGSGSSVGVASGLAVIGATVGGSVATGAAITTAVPVVTASLVGYGLYKAVKWFRG